MNEFWQLPALILIGILVPIGILVIALLVSIIITKVKEADDDRLE